MKNNSDFNAVSLERYIELKEMAYKLYEEYNLLDRQSRLSYLDALPEFDNPIESEIIRTTLLFPDTEEFLTSDQKAFSRVLNRIAREQDDINARDVTFKIFEYQMMGTQKLLSDGTLKLMDSLSYPDCSITSRDYLALKNEALEAREVFLKQSLDEKARLIESVAQDNHYHYQIQLATVLIPDDKELMAQLARSTATDLAAHYKVPESLIEFKKAEYSMQGTERLIPKFKMEKVTTPLSKLWYKDDLDTDLIVGLWDQSFYKGIEDEKMARITTSLSKLYDDAPTKKRQSNGK